MSIDSSFGMPAGNAPCDDASFSRRRAHSKPEAAPTRPIYVSTGGSAADLHTAAMPAAHSTASRGPMRLLRLAQVMDITGLRKTKIYELQAEGEFPMRVKITTHAVGWIEDEVQAWIARRVEISISVSD